MSGLQGVLRPAGTVVSLSEGLPKLVLGWFSSSVLTVMTITSWIEKEKLAAFQSPYIRSLIGVPALGYKGRAFLVLEHMRMSVSDMLMVRQYPPLKAVVLSVLDSLRH
jgi:hypothetical protein